MDIKIGVWELENTTRTICEALLLNCTLISYNYSEFGTAYPNGTVTGVVGMVHSGIFDTFQPFFTPTYARFQFIDFSDTYLYSDIMLATRANTDTSGKLNFEVLIAVKWQTLLVFLAALAIITIYVSLTGTGFGSRQRKPTSKFTVSGLIDTLPGMVTHKHEEKYLKFEFVRVMVTFWSLAIIVLASAYTGFLFSEKMKDPNSLPFRDLETFVECFDSGKCDIITESVSRSTIQALLVKSQVNRTDVRLELLEDIPRLILEEQDVHLVWPIDKLIFTSYAGNNSDCKFYIIPGFTEVWSFPLRKNSPFKPALDRGAALFQENGWSQMEFDQQNWITCTQRADARTASESNTFTSVFNAALCLFGLGMGGGLGLFLVEVIRKHRKGNHLANDVHPKVS